MPTSRRTTIKFSQEDSGDIREIVERWGLRHANVAVRVAVRAVADSVEGERLLDVTVEAYGCGKPLVPGEAKETLTVTLDARDDTAIARIRKEWPEVDSASAAMLFSVRLLAKSGLVVVPGDYGLSASSKEVKQ